MHSIQKHESLYEKNFHRFKPKYNPVKTAIQKKTANRELEKSQLTQVNKKKTDCLKVLWISRTIYDRDLLIKTTQFEKKRITRYVPYL